MSYNTANTIIAWYPGSKRWNRAKEHVCFSWTQNWERLTWRHRWHYEQPLSSPRVCLKLPSCSRHQAAILWCRCQHCEPLNADDGWRILFRNVWDVQPGRFCWSGEDQAERDCGPHSQWDDHQHPRGSGDWLLHRGTPSVSSDTKLAK